MKRFLVKSILLAILMFGISWIPLVGAFDYEAALAVALFGVVAIPMVSPRKPEKTASSLALTWAAGIVYWMVAAGIALGTASLQGELCAFWKGLEWQLLIALPSNLLVALLWGWISRGISRQIGRVVIYGLLVLVDLAIAGYALYEWPALVVMGQFFGYFAGSIYDEAIDVFPAIVQWRVGTLALILCLWGAQFAQARLWRRIVLPILGVAIAVGVHVGLALTGQPVYQGRDALRHELWAQAVPENGAFVVHYRPQSKNRDDMEREKQRILSKMMHDYRENEAFFETHPAKPFDIWLYPDVETKGKMLGARRTSIARVWKNEIHLVAGSPEDSVSHHEMAHLFAGEFAKGPWRLAGGLIPAMGWVEGLAMASEWPVQTFDLHTWSAAIIRRNDLFPNVGARTLLYGFWSLPSKMAYTLAGSWVKWLIERYGIENVKKMSSGGWGDFEKITGTSIDVAFEVWKSDLRRFYASPRADRAVSLAFGNRSIWTKHCARLRAAQNEAWYACLYDPSCDNRALFDGSYCPQEQNETLEEAEKWYAFYRERGAVDDLGIASENVETYSASQWRQRIFSILNQIDPNEIPESTRYVWMERSADMMWHGHWNLQAMWMYHAMLGLDLPEPMLRRLEIKHQAAAFGDTSNAVLAWLTTRNEREKMRLASKFASNPMIAYLDFVAAFHQNDEKESELALYRIFTHLSTDDDSARLTPRCWTELFRLMAIMASLR